MERGGPTLRRPLAPGDYVVELGRHLKRYREEPTWKQDHAGAFAMCAWHLVDVVWRSHLSADAAVRDRLGCSTRDHLFKLVTKECPALERCCYIAKSIKHPPIPNQPGVNNGRISASAVMTATGTAFVAKVTEILAPPDGSRAEETMQCIYEYWLGFFDKYQLT